VAAIDLDFVSGLSVRNQEMAVPDKGTLDRVARAISRPGAGAPGDAIAIILAQAAAYGANPGAGTATAQSGFEATVEAAFLVANADGEFDEEERSAFQQVVLQACNHLVQADLMQSLLSELGERLAADGIEKRASAVARSLTRRDQQLEVLRTAALMAEVTGGVATAERNVLETLARGCALDRSAVDQALEEAEAALMFQLD
jgi:tellurite resistance protein